MKLNNEISSNQNDKTQAISRRGEKVVVINESSYQKLRGNKFLLPAFVTVFML